MVMGLKYLTHILSEPNRSSVKTEGQDERVASVIRRNNTKFHFKETIFQ